MDHPAHRCPHCGCPLDRRDVKSLVDLWERCNWPQSLRVWIAVLVLVATVLSLVSMFMVVTGNS